MSKMTSHEPFGHIQRMLWAKEGVGVKLAIWLPTTKSWELTRPKRVQVECNTPLEIFQGELQVFLRPHPNRKCEQEVMNTPSLGSPNWDSFGRDSTLGVSRKSAIRMQVRRSNIENSIWEKVVASLESGPWWVKWICVTRGLSQD
jgi:hypothetical protein